VKLGTGRILLIEGKGRKDEKDDAKLTAAGAGLRPFNQWGKLRTWSHHICFREAETAAAIDEASV
jgi:hypothetical protein